jgi:hypothetical protein
MQPWAKLIVIATILGAVGDGRASGGCDVILMQQYRDCVRVVESLRPSKSVRARMFAYDGSEYSATQASWMKSQLREFGRLCASGLVGDRVQAVGALHAVQELIRSHRNSV